MFDNIELVHITTVAVKMQQCFVCVCAELCHYQLHRSIYACTAMLLWQIYVMGKSTVYVVHVE